MNYQFKTKPFEHQAKALAKILKNDWKGSGLFFDPGLGKTKTAIDFCGIRYLQGKVKKVLIVAPLSILGVWDEEIDTHLPRKIPRTVWVIDGKKDKKVRWLKEQGKGLQFKIITYESCTLMRDEVAKWRPDMIIADECQMIKNPQAKRSKALHYLGRRAEYRMGLTGTPVAKNPLDIYSIFEFIDDKVFNTTWTYFKQYYAEFGGYYGYEIVQWKNLRDMAERIRTRAIRVKKEEALDLPEKLFQVIPITLKPDTAEMYNSMANEMMVELGNLGELAVGIALTKMQKLEQITGGFIMREVPVEGADKPEKQVIDFATYEKINTTMYYLEKFILDEEQKVVVFCKFVWEIEKLAELSRKAELNPMVIYGATKKDDRDAIRERFQNDPKYKLIIAHEGTGGVGITLTAAHICIYHSVDHRLDWWIQSQDRLHRIGQKNKVLYLCLMVKGSIDEEKLKALKAKKNLADLVVDNYKQLFKPIGG
jgi:SNF2 family DNA or RNA helicase